MLTLPSMFALFSIDTQLHLSDLALVIGFLVGGAKALLMFRDAHRDVLELLSKVTDKQTDQRDRLDKHDVRITHHDEEIIAHDRKLDKHDFFIERHETALKDLN